MSVNIIDKDSFIYLNGKLLKLNEEAKQNLIENILNLNLKKGDSFKYLPFNYFKDENTSYKERKKKIHRNLYIEDIKYSIIDSWNRSVRVRIELYLKILEKSNENL